MVYAAIKPRLVRWSEKKKKENAQQGGREGDKLFTDIQFKPVIFWPRTGEKKKKNGPDKKGGDNREKVKNWSIELKY